MKEDEMKRGAFLRPLLCGVLLFVIAYAPAQAGFYIGLRGGLSNQNVTGGSIKFNEDSAFLYGAQVGVKFLSFALEGEFYRASHNLFQETPLQVVLPPQDMSYYYLGVNGKLGLPLSVIYPYLTVGFGTYTANLKGLGKKSDMSFNVGAGAELYIGKVGVFAELRYTDFSMDFDNHKWDFGGLDVHAGLNIHF
jgi:hypothetical protein